MTKRKSRPDLIKELTNLWEGKYKATPYLKAVSIGQKSLRGVRNSRLELKFPVTVLCGPNSTGKTTFIALSALAFHHEETMTLNNPQKSYFAFNYFFGSTEKEKIPAGVQIEWEYTNSTKRTVVKGEQRWMRYIKNNGEPSRPERGVEFVGLSRIVPAFEKRGYQKLFASYRKTRKKKQIQSLPPRYRL